MFPARPSFRPSSRFAVLAGCLLLAGAGGVAAQSGPELLKSRGCANCHAPDARKVGPSHREIAAKHKGDPAAIDPLVRALKAGRTHPRIPAPDVELQVMVRYMVVGR